MMPSGWALARLWGSFLIPRWAARVFFAASSALRVARGLLVFNGAGIAEPKGLRPPRPSYLEFARLGPDRFVLREGDIEIEFDLLGDGRVRLR
jgi:hypothetical protein